MGRAMRAKLEALIGEPVLQARGEPPELVRVRSPDLTEITAPSIP
jgi:hypothetical protein